MFLPVYTFCNMFVLPVIRVIHSPVTHRSKDTQDVIILISSYRTIVYFQLERKVLS